MTDRSTAALRAVRAAGQSALETIGARAERYARALAPVRTGALRDSIRHRVSEGRLTVYSDAGHAAYVELGTAPQDRGPAKARPFLRPAMLDHAAEYRDILKRMLVEGLSENRKETDAT